MFGHRLLRLVCVSLTEGMEDFLVLLQGQFRPRLLTC